MCSMGQGTHRNVRGVGHVKVEGSSAHGVESRHGEDNVGGSRSGYGLGRGVLNGLDGPTKLMLVFIVANEWQLG